MAYMNQERKAKISAAVKPLLKKWGLKGTLKTSIHSITLTIRSGSIDFGGDRQQVNHYWIHDHYEGTAKEALLELREALEAGDYYDRSDAMTDYFDTAYYYSIQIGDWRKPYVMAAEVKEAA